MIICDVYIIMLGNPNYTVDNLVYKISDDVWVYIYRLIYFLIYKQYLLYNTIL
jgi:hypothetical protein